MCLNAVLKVTKVAESRMEAGILFQVAGAETANEYCRSGNLSYGVLFQPS